MGGSGPEKKTGALPAWLPPWFPWKGALVSVGASFLAASVLSTFIAQLFFPASETPRTTTAAKPTPAKDLNLRSAASLTSAQVDLILKRNIFNSEDEQEDQAAKPQEKPQDQEDNAVKSDLPVKLLGTIYSGDPYTGAAIIENPSKRTTNTFMVGDSLIQGAKILEILRERIIVENQGRREYIDVEKTKLVRSRRQKKSSTGASSPGIKPIATEPPPQTYKEEGFERVNSDIDMTEAYRQKLLTTDFTKVLQDAKASPNMVDGELRGFKLTRIRKDSIYEKAGLQNDDVVEEINGVPLTDTAQAIKLLQSLRNEKEIEVRVNRAGQTVRFKLNIR